MKDLLSGHKATDRKLKIFLSMRKVIAALNMTIDGICDHTVGIPDEEIHQHYTELL